MVDYLPFASYQISNGGVYKHRSENSDSATPQEVDKMIDRHRQFAQFYTRRYLDYMCYNSNLYPEYNNNDADGMWPDYTADFTGWVL